MKAVLQRVSSARVAVGHREVGAIGGGILALVGVEPGDGRWTSSTSRAKCASCASSTMAAAG